MKEQKKFRYYDLIMAAFVTVILCSNLIGVHKVSVVSLPFYGEFIFGAGVLFFPISYLFGDILAVSRVDLLVIWGGVLAVLALLWWRWSALLLATLSDDLAYAAGINPRREQMVLTIALALVVAVAIKVVGVLLIAALLIIPAAAARPFSVTPERMAVLAAGIGAFSAIGGLQLAYVFDTPTGPSIVCLAAACFALTSLLGLMRGAQRG